MCRAVRRRTLTVGVDGSAGGDAALRYALEEAQARGATVRVVRAVGPPELSSFDDYARPAPEDGRAAAAADIDRRVRELREQLGLDVETEAVVASGPTVPVLLDAARDAELLVVGHRGRGAWRSALFGSVGLTTLLAAPCPVIVVPAGPRSHGSTVTRRGRPAGSVRSRARRWRRAN